MANPETSKTLQEDFASIGFDNIQLIVPMDQAEQYSDDNYENISPEIFTKDMSSKNILDVRTNSEYHAGNLESAAHIHFGKLQNADIPFNNEDKIYVHCTKVEDTY